MDVFLRTTDDQELKKAIRDMRGFPMVLQWDSKERGNVIPRFFVRTGSVTKGNYRETHVEPVLETEDQGESSQGSVSTGPP